LKAEALNFPLWWTRLGRGYGPVERQTTWWWLHLWNKCTIYQSVYVSYLIISHFVPRNILFVSLSTYFVQSARHLKLNAEYGWQAPDPCWAYGCKWYKIYIFTTKTMGWATHCCGKAPRLCLGDSSFELELGNMLSWDSSIFIVSTSRQMPRYCLDLAANVSSYASIHSLWSVDSPNYM